MGSLDDGLARLLSAEGSVPAAVAKGFLIGLSAALAEVPLDDPYRRRVEPVVRAIAEVLARGEAQPLAGLSGGPPPITGAAAWQPAPGATAAADAPVSIRGGAMASAPVSTAVGRGLDLAALWSEAIEAAGERSPGEAPRDTGALWADLHLLTLRMSADDRKGFDERIAGRARAGGASVGPGGHLVRGPARETLIPSLKVNGQTLAEGLATDPDADLPEELVPPAATATDRTTADGVRLVVPVLRLIFQDRYLRHCLQALQFRGFGDLSARAEQDRLEGQLVRRTLALVRAQPGTPEWLERMVRVHEAVSSVVHIPPAPEGSWWGQLRLRGHALIRDAANTVSPGLVKLPPARYATALALTEHNIPLKLPESSGQVVACVKVWSRIHDTENPGRVIYGS